MLEFKDWHYFQDCLNGEERLWIPIQIKRTIYLERRSDYPDDPIQSKTSIIHTFGDIREVPFNEIGHSNGVLVVGDNQIFCKERLIGPGRLSSTGQDQAADIVVINGVEWGVLGYPWKGNLNEPMTGGYTAFIRRRQS